jgi:hypothetical protein
MAHTPHDHGPGAGRDDAPPRVPRWVKAFTAVLGVLVLAAVLVMLISGGEHGPGRHSSGSDDAPTSHSQRVKS